MHSYKVVPMTARAGDVERDIRPTMRQAVTIPLEIEIDGRKVRSISVYVVESAFTLPPDLLSTRNMVDIASIVAGRLRHTEEMLALVRPRMEEDGNV